LLGWVPSDAFGGGDLVPAFEGSFSEGGDSGLHANFDSFPWTEEDVGDDFSGGGGGEIDEGTVFIGSFLSDDIGVFLLEQFVETVFTGAYMSFVFSGEGPWKEYPTRVGPQPVKFPLNPSAR